MHRVSAREAHALMENDGYAYLDVRTVPEFEQGHPCGAINVPWLTPAPDGTTQNPDFLAQVTALFAPDAPIVVGCASGVRSLAAAQALEAHGFSRLLEQRAGMLGVRDPFGRVQERGWRDEGLPLSTERAQDLRGPEK
jgi:rhodanese-related sulfurtransferase